MVSKRKNILITDFIRQCKNYLILAIDDCIAGHALG